MEGEGGEIKSKQASKRDRTLLIMVKDFNIILFHSKDDAYCDKSTTKFDHKNSLTIKSIGKFEEIVR